MQAWGEKLGSDKDMEYGYADLNQAAKPYGNVSA
jgi:hypothetical protein